jgi:hypothetical protein
MKTLYLLLLFTFLSFNAMSHRIDSIKFIPQAPNNVDEVTLVIYAHTTNYPASTTFINHYKSNDTFYISACYNYGLFTIFGYINDTLTFGILDTGTYYIDMISFANQGLQTCLYRDTLTNFYSFRVEPHNSVKEINQVKHFQLFPNPITNNKMFVQYHEDKNASTTWQIMDMQGKIIRTGIQVFSKGEQELNAEFSDLPKGIYLLHLKSDEFAETHKLILH